jgi:hypothetical protein
MIRRSVADPECSWLGGMFLSLAERPEDLVQLVNDQMDPELRQLSQSFCSMENTDQAFGSLCKSSLILQYTYSSIRVFRADLYSGL